ncbi:MAG: tandem-95 repeat protein, partial [Mycolicibacterium cosmeticum]|nr:tandem-95 repeat protein [Mycolicibacterium cosmeticum]
MTTARHRQAMSARNNRKARRAAKVQPEVPAVAVLPAPALVSGPGYARYVGRVGALAVALGLGAAVATGYGLGIPAVASAENGSESTENSPNDPPNPQDPPAEPGGNGSGSGTGAGSVGPTVPEMQLPDHAGSQQPSNTSNPSEMQVSVSGGAQLTGSGAQNGSSNGNTQTPTTHSQTPTPTQEPLVNNGLPSGGTTPSTSQTQSGYVAPTGTTTPTAPQGNPTPNVEPNQSGHVGPELSGTTTTTVIHGSGTPTQPGNSAARLAGTQPNLQTFSTAAGASFTSQLSLATASGTPAPAALVNQPDNPLEALIGAPAALANIAVTAISMFFNSLLNPGPGTPAPPVMLFVVLGWAQRELARTFFNQSPNGVADNIGTNEDTGVTIPVLSNDTDGDLGVGDVLTVTDYTQPANGSVALNPNGTFTYTPDANFNGTDTFTYTVSDEASPWHMHGLGGFFFGGAHAAAPTTVTITVGSVNDAPVAVDDAFTVNEDVPTVITPLSNDTDVDNSSSALTITGTGATAHGGTVVVAADGKSVTYTSAPDFNGTDTFTYTVSDGTLTDTGTVTITVLPVNDPPVANPDFFTTNEDVPLTGDPAQYLTNNDTDVDLDNLTATILTQPT